LSYNAPCSIIELGYYYDGNNVRECTAGNYCLGGTTKDAVQLSCGSDKTSNAGASSASQCFVPLNVNASYYSIAPGTPQLPNLSQLTPYRQSKVATIYYPNTGGLFADSGRSDYVAAVFTGTLNIPTAGAWTFYLASDDGSKMYLSAADDPTKLIISNDGLHPTQERSATVSLSPGPQKLRIEFFENTGDASLMLSWEGPGISKRPVPATAWVA
jgi:hypothetical protein